MIVYIIAAQRNILFGKNLIKDIDNIVIKLSDDNTLKHVEKQLSMPDVILAIIDNDYSENSYLDYELQLAYKMSQKSKKIKLISVILDDAIIPKYLKDGIHIRCDTMSRDDVAKTKFVLERIMFSKRGAFRKIEAKTIHNQTSSMILMTVAIELFAMFCAFVLLRDNSHFSNYKHSFLGIENVELVFVTFAISVAFAVLITSYYLIIRRRQYEEKEKEIDSYSRRLQRAIVPNEVNNKSKTNRDGEQKAPNVDALGLMMLNLEDINEFYIWSQKQAKASFVFAVITCVVGLALIVIATVLYMIAKSNIQGSLILAIGGAITELIAGTALVVYKTSLVQLNHYHKAMHEDERFLSSVNLLGKFSTVEAQDDMLREIIRSEIQMNMICIDNGTEIITNSK